MTDPNDSLVASLETFEQFGTRLVEGLRARGDGEITSPGPEITTSTRDAVCAEATSGALLGRTVWGAEGAEHSGCFLWIGGVEALIGDGEKPASDLTDDEAQMLDQALRLNIEEAADEPPPLDWSALELLPAEQVGDALRETGIPDDCEVCRIPLTVKGREQTFLFLMAPTGEAETTAESPPAAEKPAAERADGAVLARSECYRRLAIRLRRPELCERVELPGSTAADTGPYSVAGCVDDIAGGGSWRRDGWLPATADFIGIMRRLGYDRETVGAQDGYEERAYADFYVDLVHGDDAPRRAEFLERVRRLEETGR